MGYLYATRRQIKLLAIGALFCLFSQSASAANILLTGNIAYQTRNSYVDLAADQKINNTQSRNFIHAGSMILKEPS